MCSPQYDNMTYVFYKISTSHMNENLSNCEVVNKYFHSQWFANDIMWQFLIEVLFTFPI